MTIAKGALFGRPKIKAILGGVALIGLSGIAFSYVRRLTGQVHLVTVAVASLCATSSVRALPFHRR